MKIYKVFMLLILLLLVYCGSYAQTYNFPPPEIPGPGNPFLKGQQGNWRVKRTQVYLVSRAASRSGDVPNLRKDGVFETFDPFWTVPSGNSINWQPASSKWTVSKEATKYSPHGQAVEEKDALGIFSTVQYGYNGFLVVLVGANSQYQEAGFDGFEDYGFNTCSDDHFNFSDYVSQVTRDEFHTGRKSIKIPPGSKVSMTRPVGSCLTTTAVKFPGGSIVDQILK